MGRIITLSIAALIAIGGTSVGRTQTAEQNGDDVASRVTQHDRQKYSVYIGDAAAALSNGNLAAAMESATKAYVYVPEASDVKFNAVDGGILATVKDLNTDKIQKFNLSPQQFGQVIDITKEGQFDRVLTTGGMGAVLQRITGSTTNDAKERRRSLNRRPAIRGRQSSSKVASATDS